MDIGGFPTATKLPLSVLFCRKAVDLRANSYLGGVRQERRAFLRQIGKVKKSMLPGAITFGAIIRKI
jgi:hypothetical protein